MSDYYYRLVTFLIDICLPEMRKIFLHCAQNDPGVPFITLKAYMKSRKKNVNSLVKVKVLRKEQLDIVFPKTGLFDENKWDISLLATLLLSLFGKTVQAIKSEVQSIRDQRNDLSHTPNTKISDIDFNKNWADIESWTIAIVSQFKTADIPTVTSRICELKNRLLDPSHTLDVINEWYLNARLEHISEIRDLKDEIIEMKKQLGEVNDATQKTCLTVKKASVKQTGRSGKPSKRIRVLNSYDEKFRADFKLVMSKGIPDTFIPPEEVEEVKERLMNNHIVVVTGYGDSTYLQVALFAIRELKYEERFCALLTDPSFWFHVDSEETKLVVFKDPFGSLAYDQYTSTAMLNKLDAIESAVGDDAGLDVVIVSKREFVNEAMRFLGKTHDLLEGGVTVYTQVSVQTPFSMADQTLRISEKSKDGNFQCEPAANIASFSESFFQRHTLDTIHANELDLDVASVLSKISDKQTLVITGTNQDLTYHVASNIFPKEKKVFTLSHSEHLTYVDLKNIDVLLVEDFAGKYVFDKFKANKWFETFDQIKPKIEAGCFKLVLVTPRQRLTECRNALGFHWALKTLCHVPPTAIGSNWYVHLKPRRLI